MSISILTLLVIIVLVVLLVWIATKIPTPWRWLLIGTSAVVVLLVLLEVAGLLHGLGSLSKPIR